MPELVLETLLGRNATSASSAASIVARRPAVSGTSTASSTSVASSAGEPSAR